MPKEPFFKELKPLSQIAIFLALVFLGLFLFSLLSTGLVATFFDMSLNEIQTLSKKFEHPDAIPALKLIQSLSQIGIFILPPLIFVKLTQTKSIKQYFKFYRPDNDTTYLWAIAGVFTIMPFIGMLIQWNLNMTLPESMAGIEEWMKQSEESTNNIMKAFLDVSSISGVMVNLFVIAVLPAVGEELLFRGGIQQIMHKSGVNKHIAVFFTAILFSAFHMQFYGFLPRFVLGLLLGYAFYMSGSLWIPIIMHFINNGFSVIASYLFYNGSINENYDEIGMTQKAIPIMLSLILTIYVLWRIRQNEKTKSII
ncbi:MAG: CPBP family intramembrane metalloprotease [Bacteroidales bacterium]|nr:CPBP family intramembrane metalloprotease [Bacteroidales bacterium]